jgi:hypothetical protein
MGVSMNGRWTICVDFGTAVSKAAAAWRAPQTAFDASHIRLLRLGEGDGDNPYVLKSVLFLEGSRIFFGEAGWRRAQAQNARANRLALSSFKTLLSSADLEDSIGQLVSPRVDPTGVFRQRELIVLYLAFLIRRIDRAQEMDRNLANVPRPNLRYSYPGWTATDSAARHRLIARLFDEGMIVADLLNKDFGANEGLSYEEARDALKRAESVKVASRIEGVVFEATAAATCSLLGNGGPTRKLVAVIDMGAGTTDIGGYALGNNGGVQEIPGVQRTIDIAGDTIDRVLMNIFLKKAPKSKKHDPHAFLWRHLIPQIRDLKEKLLITGECEVTHEGKVLKIKLKELTKRSDFKKAMRDVQNAYEASLLGIAKAAPQMNTPIAVILAGGGANYPFLQKIAAHPRIKRGMLDIQVEPLMPNWARTAALNPKAIAAFPQLSIAIGGAIAPPAFVRQRVGVMDAPTAPESAPAMALA